MTVKDAIERLTAMPQDAQLVAINSEYDYAEDVVSFGVHQLHNIQTDQNVKCVAIRMGREPYIPTFGPCV